MAGFGMGELPSLVTSEYKEGAVLLLWSSVEDFKQN